MLREPVLAPSFSEAARRWQESRVDAAEATRTQHRTALNRALPILGDRRIDAISAQHVADLVVQLHTDGKARESIRKTVTALAMVFDHAGISPNPARDRVTVKLPRDDSEEPNPPSAEHVAAVYRLIPRKHRLALLFLEGSGARVARSTARWSVTTTGPAGASACASRRRRRGGRYGSSSTSCLLTRSRRRFRRARTVTRRRGCSPAPAPTRSGRRSRRRAAGRRRSRSGARTISATDASRCFTCAGCRGRGSASESGSATSR
jgi:hypothetical protein